MTSILIKKTRDAARLRELSAMDEAGIGGGRTSRGGCEDSRCPAGVSWVPDPCPQCPPNEQGYCGDVC